MSIVVISNSGNGKRCGACHVGSTLGFRLGGSGTGVLWASKGRKAYVLYCKVLYQVWRFVFWYWGIKVSKR